MGPSNFKNVDPNLCTHAELFGFLNFNDDFEVRLNPAAKESKKHNL